ncbi:MAG: DUF3422 family protein [Candidatus Puniceispirillales bacterium]
MKASPLRAYIDRELHLRPFMRLRQNQRIFNFALHTGETRGQREWRHFRKVFIRDFGIELPDESQPFFQARKDDLGIRIEKHSEFFSISLIYDDAVRKGRNLSGVFAPAATEMIPEALLRDAPSPVLVATWVETIDDQRELEPRDVAKIFGHENFAAATVSDEGARVYHSFKLDDHPYLEGGFIRILVQNDRLRSRRLGRLVQRLIEIEQYRHFALLSLPVVRALAGELSGLEHDIADITQSMAMKDTEDSDDKLQRELSQLSRIMGHIERISAQSAYRLAATEAYATIVRTRIGEVREGRVEGFQKIEEFLDRRLAPALRTCAAFGRRIENLASRAQRSNTLLRTRIDMRIQLQNNLLLRRMEERAGMQMRLQETVELLSIAAVTYYVVSLLSYFLGGFDDGFVKDQKPLLLAVAVPFVAGLLFVILHQVRRRLGRSGKD